MRIIYTILGLFFSLLVLVIGNMYFMISGTASFFDDFGVPEYSNVKLDIEPEPMVPEIVSESGFKNISGKRNSVTSRETIKEIITRLKRDVKLTGTIIGVPRNETAMFQIEGMPDRLFNINEQLMDGFIIIEITKSTVILKNQIGNERFSLQVKNGS